MEGPERGGGPGVGAYGGGEGEGGVEVGEVGGGEGVGVGVHLGNEMWGRAGGGLEGEEWMG